MIRKVECQIKELRIVEGTAESIHTEENTVGPVAETKHKEEYYLVFYDIDESVHRNAYPIFLSTKEANEYEVGKIYTLTIG